MSVNNFTERRHNPHIKPNKDWDLFFKLGQGKYRLWNPEKDPAPRYKADLEADIVEGVEQKDDVGEGAAEDDDLGSRTFASSTARRRAPERALGTLPPLMAAAITSPTFSTASTRCASRCVLATRPSSVAFRFHQLPPDVVQQRLRLPESLAAVDRPGVGIGGGAPQANGVAGEVRQFAEPGGVHTARVQHVQQRCQVVREGVGLAQRSELGLEQFLGRRLHVKAENFVGKDGRVIHAEKRRDVLLRRCHEYPGLLWVAHRAPCPPATRVRAHG